MTEASYTAWDDKLYQWPPPEGWYQAADGKWWPDGYGPPPGEAETSVATAEEDTGDVVEAEVTSGAATGAEVSGIAGEDRSGSVGDSISDQLARARGGTSPGMAGSRTGLTGAASRFGDRLSGAAASARGAIGDVAGSATERISGLPNVVGGDESAETSDGDVTDGTDVADAADAVGSEAGDAADAIADRFGAAASRADDAAGSAADAFGSAGSDVADRLGDAAGDAADRFGDAAGSAGAGLADRAGSAADRLSGLGDAAGSATDRLGAFGDAAGSAGSGAADRIGDAAGSATDRLGAFGDAAGSAGSGLADGAADAAGSVADRFGSAGSGLADGVGDAAESVADRFGSAGSGLADGAADAAGSATDRFGSAGSGLADGAADVAGSATDRLGAFGDAAGSATGSDLADGAADAAGSVADRFGSAGSGLADGAADAAGSAGDRFGSAGSGLADGAADTAGSGLADRVDDVADAAGDALDTTGSSLADRLGDATDLGDQLDAPTDELTSATERFAQQADSVFEAAETRLDAVDIPSLRRASGVDPDAVDRARAHGGDAADAAAETVADIGEPGPPAEGQVGYDGHDGHDGHDGYGARPPQGAAATKADLRFDQDYPHPGPDQGYGYDQDGYAAGAPGDPRTTSPYTDYGDGPHLDPRAAGYDPREALGARAPRRRGFGRMLLMVLLGVLVLIGIGAALYWYLADRSDDTGDVAEPVITGPGSAVEPHPRQSAVVVFYPDDAVNQRWVIEVLEPVRDAAPELAVAPEEGRAFAATRVRVRNESGATSALLSDLQFNAVTPSGQLVDRLANQCPPGPDDLPYNASVATGGQVEGSVCWSVPANELTGLLLGIESSKVAGRVHISLN